MDKELRNCYRRIGRVICHYYLSAPGAFEPTVREYQEWLQELSPEEQAFYRKLGFQVCRAANAFRQNWLERRGYSLKDYLQVHLSPLDYAIFCQRPVLCEEADFSA
ncbi:hypothetical protein ACFQ4C_05965 [Larkinella insperata]|uniref:Uncharacterized protein n=1 Tax=Larkinella insperata TaxID=332158 RepID=A0ABW3QA25_9BACT|nr:hypothetical protein [Larkinella insperata]